MELSIIIAVYNLENYIPKCLQSIWDQDINESQYEVIIINDGSKDNSLKIIEEFCRSKSNVKIITQENQTQSVARNNGLKIAKGQYVWFVDGDDWIEKNCLKEILFISNNNKLDILNFSFLNILPNGFKSNSKGYGLPQAYFNKVIKGEEYFNSKRISFSPCSYLFKLSFLKENSLNFYSGIYYEDNEFLPRVIYLSKRLMCYDKVCYYALSRPNSTIRSINPKKVFDLIKVISSLINFSNNISSHSSKKVMNYYIALTFNTLLNELIKINSIKVDNQVKIKLKTNKLKIVNAFLCSGNLKYFIEGIILLLSFNFLILITKFIKNGKN